MTTIGRKGWILLFSVWAAVQLFWLLFYGIYTQEEAQVYIGIANEIADGNYSQSIHYWLYAGYIAPLAILSWLGLPVQIMYGVQLILGLLAMWCFVKILCATGVRKSAILLGGILFATSPLFHSWNTYLYTDGFWGNAVVILIYLIQRNSRGTQSQFLFLFAMLIVGCFTRPVGFLMVPIVILHLRNTNAPKSRWLMLTGWLILFSFFVSYALQNGTDFFYPKHNLELNIICGLPSDLKKYETRAFEPGMSIPTYFFSNPELTARLFVSRLAKSLWMTREYFSAAHNMMNGLACFIYYLLAIPGILYVIVKKLRFWYYIISGLVIWLIPNIVFCADWHNRFMVPFIPFLLIMATFGIEFVLSIKGNRVSSH
jgi:hypothetical protein